MIVVIQPNRDQLISQLTHVFAQQDTIKTLLGMTHAHRAIRHVQLAPLVIRTVVLLVRELGYKQGHLAYVVMDITAPHQVIPIVNNVNIVALHVMEYPMLIVCHVILLYLIEYRVGQLVYAIQDIMNCLAHKSVLGVIIHAFTAEGLLLLTACNAINPIIETIITIIILVIVCLVIMMMAQILHVLHVIQLAIHVQRMVLIIVPPAISMITEY